MKHIIISVLKKTCLEIFQDKKSSSTYPIMLQSSQFCCIDLMVCINEKTGIISSIVGYINSIKNNSDTKLAVFFKD